MKRLLLLSYYFPPAGGPGVQRMLKTVHYLPDFGWQPIVVTVRSGAFSDQDRTLMEDVPVEAIVRRTSSIEPYRTYARLTGKQEGEAVKVGSVGEADSWGERLAHWIRANLFLPDARVGWVPFAAIEALRIIRTHRVDAILTTGPPHSTHLSGWIVHRLTEIPWIADFRDPWTDINYYHELPHTACARSIDKALERLVLRGADGITTVSPSWKALLETKATPSPRVEVVHNGFDARDFEAKPSADERGEFVITHVGSMYSSRNPRPLWKAMAALRSWGELAALRIRLVGAVDEVVLHSIREHDLADIVDHIPYVPHAEAVSEMCRSTLLLLVIEDFPQNAGMITGKLYEYVASGRPVLGIGPPQGDAAALLEETGGGRIFDPGDDSALEAYLLEQYRAWDADSAPTGAVTERILPYTRKAQTERLVELLNMLVAMTSRTADSPA